MEDRLQERRKMVRKADIGSLELDRDAQEASLWSIKGILLFRGRSSCIGSCIGET